MYIYTFFYDRLLVTGNPWIYFLLVDPLPCTWLTPCMASTVIKNILSTYVLKLMKQPTNKLRLQIWIHRNVICHKKIGSIKRRF